MEESRFRRVCLSIALFSALFHSATSTDHEVGGKDNGWTIGANLQAWAQNEIFVVGDTLSMSQSFSNYQILL